MPIRAPRKGEKTSAYISKVVKQEIKAGRPQKQAVAIAYASARRYGRKVARKK